MNRQPLDSISVSRIRLGMRPTQFSGFRTYTVDVTVEGGSFRQVRFAPAGTRPVLPDTRVALRFVLRQPLPKELASGLPVKRLELDWKEVAMREPLLEKVAEHLLANTPSYQYSPVWILSLAVLFLTILAETLVEARPNWVKPTPKALRSIF